MADYITLSSASRGRSSTTDADVYQRLDHTEGHIRVFELQPGKWDDDLRGELRVVDLTKKPTYEALSYTWGTPPKHERQGTNSSARHSINGNLYCALRRLRQQRTVRTLWVDALCIDQENNREKSQQVAMMGRIYSCASAVLIWLGEYPNGRDKDSHSTRLPHWNRFTKLNSRGEKYAEALNETLRLAHPKWQDRAWVVQEFVLARKVVLCFGPVSMLFDKMHLQDLTERLPRRLEYLLAFFYKVSDMVKLGIGSRENRMQGIHDAALYARAAACGKPEDKVYSLLSLIDPEEVSLIPVDYGLSTALVFARATYAFIVTRKSFAIMELVHLEANLQHEIPSWAVDFTAEQDAMDSQLHIHLDEIFEFPARDSSLQSFVSLDQSDLHLTVAAYYLGTFKDCLELPMASFDLSGGVVLEVARSLSKFLHRVSKQLHRDLQPIAETVCIAENLLIHGPKTQVISVIKASFTLWDDLANPGDDASYIPFWSLSREQKITRVANAVGPEPILLLSYIKFLRGTASIFITSKHNLGIGPATLIRGPIMLPINSRLPMILEARSVGSWGAGPSRFKGFAWVHGLAAGRLKQRVEEGTIVQKKFVLE
ncbi:hypothetical protein LTR09_000039 [Extremus antarcticus]|uniref:Heterokaryon incompatibility domain-containing protein n=1 Tax=Extremus antarcticus TaxID=702011 RepID=A0AAJ0GIV9_9PEZI|nr:hypothetical protein LTR09_000039 [Extremus antarcticus]